MRRFLFLLLIFIAVEMVVAQDTKSEMITRVAQIEVYPNYLAEYLQAANEVATTSMQNGEGVLLLYPMQQKHEKNKILILEAYRDQEAYQAHIHTPLFIEYQ